MFQIGEVVAYGATGICIIENICITSLNRSGTNKQEYYVLRPKATPTCLTYVPTSNSKLLEKMRKLMTRQEIDALLDAVKGRDLDWIPDARQRADQYGQILFRGLTEELLLLIQRLYLEKKACSSAGRRFSTADERLLVNAERTLSEEFSYALEIPEKDVPDYIAQRLEKE